MCDDDVHNGDVDENNVNTKKMIYIIPTFFTIDYFSLGFFFGSLKRKAVVVAL